MIFLISKDSLEATTMKQKIIIIALASCMFMFVACGANTTDEPVVEQDETMAEETNTEDSVIDTEETIIEENDASEDKEALRDAFEDEIGGSGLTFYSNVHNDNTGNWRVAVIYTSENIVDHAVNYYNAYYGTDDEVHFICNLGLRTTTRFNVYDGVIYASTFDYVDGEEHDANVLPGGDLVTSYSVNIETGEIEENTENQ